MRFPWTEAIDLATADLLSKKGLPNQWPALKAVIGERENIQKMSRHMTMHSPTAVSGRASSFHQSRQGSTADLTALNLPLRLRTALATTPSAPRSFDREHSDADSEWENYGGSEGNADGSPSRVDHLGGQGSERMDTGYVVSYSSR